MVAARIRLGKRLRSVVVFVHVAVSVGWMGAGAANVVLAFTAATSAEIEVWQVCYAMIDRIDFVLVIPCAFAALISGLVLSWCTPWGLFRHWWVMIKFVLTCLVIVFSTWAVGVWVEVGMQTSRAGGPNPYAWFLVVGAGGNIIAFLFMTFVSVGKPWRTTPWARTRRPSRRPSGRGSGKPVVAART